MGTETNDPTMSRLFRILLIASVIALPFSMGACVVAGTPHKSPPPAGEPAAAPEAKPAAAPEVTPTAAPEPSGPQPRIEFENPVCDFGEVWQGASADCVFKLRNTGDADLHIADVKSACGCTVAEIAKKTLAPGEAGEIKATFRSAGYRKKVDKRITVISDDPKQPKSNLTITGIVKVPVDVQPRFITVSRGRPETVETRDIRITPIEPKGFRILKTEGAPSWVRCTDPKPAPNQPGVWLITVTVGPDLPLGRLNASLNINTNDKRQPIVTVRIIGNVTEDGTDPKAPTSPAK